MQEITPSSILGWLAVATAVALGAVAIWGLLDKTLRDRRKDGMQAADDVIATLEKKIKLLEDDIKLMKIKQQQHVEQIAELKATNETLTRVLQGRDQATLDFQKTMLSSAQISVETNKTVKQLDSSVLAMVEVVTRLANAIEHNK